MSGLLHDVCNGPAINCSKEDITSKLLESANMERRLLTFVFVVGCLLAGTNSAPYSKDDYERLMTELRELAEEDNFQSTEDVDLPVPGDLREDETRHEQTQYTDDGAFEADARSEQEPSFDTFVDNTKIVRNEETPEGFDDAHGYQEDRSWEAPPENEDTDEEDRTYNTYENEALEDQEERGYDASELDDAQDFNTMNGEFNQENHQNEREMEEPNLANSDSQTFSDGFAEDFEEDEIAEDPAQRSEQMYENEDDDLEDEELEELARAIIVSVDEEIPATLNRFETRATEQDKAGGPKKQYRCKWINMVLLKVDKLKDRIKECGFRMEKEKKDLSGRGMNDEDIGALNEEAMVEDEVEDEITTALARSILDTLTEDFSVGMDGLSKRADDPKKAVEKPAPKPPVKKPKPKRYPRLCTRLKKLVLKVDKQKQCGIKLVKLAPIAQRKPTEAAKEE